MYEPGLPNFDPRMMLKNCDDISNGSRVITLTDIQTNSQADTIENNSTLATLHCADGNEAVILVS